MSDAEKTDETEAPKKSGKKGLIIGAVLALLVGGGSFYAVHSGMILGGGGDDQADAHESDAQKEMEALPAVAFVPLDPITVSLAPASGVRHLRFRGQLEVADGQQDDVAAMTPRVVDVLNSYLRAVEPAVLQQPEALLQLRSQMLRRVRLVVGEERVRDLLVMEFVLS